MKYLIPGALVCLALGSGLFAVESSQFHWDGEIGKGQVLEIKGVNGGIAAEAASSPRAEVSARKSANRSDPASVEIVVVPHSGGVTICAVYPGKDGRPNECKPGDGGRNNVSNNDVQVHFTVRVPAGVKFVGKTVNGKIDVRQLQGDAEAYTVNGQVAISTNGNAQAHTVNGAINVVCGDGNWTETREFKTVNGAISVSLPEATNAAVTANTLNGSIETDFPLTLSGFVGRKLTGTIGSGGRQLNVSTVNGRIRILKQGGRRTGSV